MRRSVVDGGFAAVVAVVALAGCGDPSVSACNGQCDKQASCGREVRVDSCHEACADSEVTGSEACQSAQLALSQCQVAQSCDDYFAGAGCDDEVDAVAADCS